MPRKGTSKNPIDKMDSIRIELKVWESKEVVDLAQTAANREAAAKCAEAFGTPVASRAALAALHWAAEHKPQHEALVRERDELKGRWRALRELLFTD